MIRSHAVKGAATADYNEYFARQVQHYQEYVAGKADALGHDMEVAEGPTRVGGDARAAAAIGLRAGEVPSMEAIALVSCGCHAESGASLVGTRGQNPDRTAYQDFVFSVPKSVSVEFAAARAIGDEVRAAQLVGAMTESVEAAIAEIQELVPLGRLWDPAAEVQRAVPARVAALLDVHSAARPVRGQTSGDPHLHVHCRILNLGLQQGGQVASVNYWMLYQNIRPLNSLFEAGLRSRLEELGYATVDATHGERREWASFELGRQDAELSAALSARTEHVQMLALHEWEGRQAELLASLQLARALQGAMGIAGEPVLGLTQAERDLCRPTPREVAALSRASREQKLATSRAELAEEWGRVCAAHGYQHQPADLPEPPCRPDPGSRGRAMAEISADALSPDGLVAGRSVFDRSDILEYVAPRAVRGRLDEGEMRSVVGRIEERAERLPATIHEPMGAFTTQEQKALEREAVEVAIDLAGEATVSVPEQLVAAAVVEEERGTGNALDVEQGQAVRALCGPSGWVQLVGVAGSGKTSVCRPAVAALERAGYQVLGVSLSQAATDVLASETGIPAWNLADFVTRVPHNLLRATDGRAVSLGPRTVLLVDEAGTVDSGRWHAFTRITREWQVAGVRVLGDPEQTQPVGSGSILGWLSRHLPTTYLTANYRQGLGGVEAEGAQLLRDGRGVDFLRLKDRMGHLRIEATSEGSVSLAATTWAAGIARGGDPRQHVLLTDLVDVAAQLNRRARVEYGRLGRLSDPHVVLGGKEWAVGERVVFAEQHRARMPVVGEGGRVEIRSDGTPQLVTMRTPRRTQGELVGIDRTETGQVVLRIQTDPRGRLPSRVVEVTEGQVARTLDHGYAMTTQVAQGRTWDTTYRLLTASRLSGRQQEYPAGTRHLIRSLLFGDTESVHAEAQDAVSLRDDAIHKHGELISRDVGKVSTLDYLSPADRSLLEARLHPRYLRTPTATLGAPMSERQAGYLTALGRYPAVGWSWVRASVEIDSALGRPAGGAALTWLKEQGIATSTGWDAIDAACREAGIAHRTPRPAPEAPPLAPHWDTAVTLDAAQREREAAAATRRGMHAAQAPRTEATAAYEMPQGTGTVGEGHHDQGVRTDAEGLPLASAGIAGDEAARASDVALSTETAEERETIDRQEDREADTVEPAAEPEIRAAEVIHRFLDQAPEAEAPREREAASRVAEDDERRCIEESEQLAREPGRDQSRGPGIGN